MPTVTSLLLPQIATVEAESEEQITLQKIEFFVNSNESTDVKFRYVNSSGKFKTVLTKDLPEPVPVLSKLQDCLQTTLSQISIPPNCSIPTVVLQLETEPTLEVHLSFQIPKPVQKSLLAISRNTLPHQLYTKNNLYVTNTEIMFREQTIYILVLHTLTNEKQLFENPPQDQFVQPLQTKNLLETDNYSMIGDSNPLWKWGTQRIGSPQYRISYQKETTRKTLESNIQRQLQVVMSQFEIPDTYRLIWQKLRITNGNSTGRFSAEINCPIPET